MCAYMHHLHIHAPHGLPIPQKYNIYLVSLPSVLYETPGHNERSVMNQQFLLLFSEKRSFMKSTVQFHEKCNAFK